MNMPASPCLSYSELCSRMISLKVIQAAELLCFHRRWQHIE